MSRQLSRKADAHKDAVWTLDWSFDEALVSGGLEGALRSWTVNPETGELKPVAAVEEFPLGVVSAVNLNGTLVAASSMDGKIRICDAKRGGAPVRVLSVGPVDCWSLAASDDEICSGTHTGAVNFWSLETGALARTLQTGGTFALSVARRGGLVAVGHMDGAVRLFDLAAAPALGGGADGGDDAAAPLSLEGHALPVRGLAFSPDGAVLYTACDDRSTLCFSTEGGERLGAMRGHTAWVMAVAASRRHVATAGADRAVKLWDPETKECLVSFDAHVSQVFAVAFNRAGTMLASGGGTGDVVVYSVVAPQR